MPNSANDNPDQAHQLMQSAKGQFHLRRVPDNPNLQAWDSADLYLLKHANENCGLSQQSKILVVNDGFGALSLALCEHQVTMTGDSYLAFEAMKNNLVLQSFDEDKVAFNDSLSLPEQAFDLILIKIPKSLALLEHQLYQLRSHLHAGTQIIAGGMTRNIHKSTLKLFETIIGPTTTTLAWKKSRLILVNRDPRLSDGHIPDPDEFILEINRELTIQSHVNVFSRDKLDAGSRLMIENMPAEERYSQIADLGCGNGILGLVAAELNPQADLSFVDESYMALASAEENFARAFGKKRAAQFKVTNCLQGFEPESIDLILNNPPFHQQYSVGDAIAWQMFAESRETLKTGGELWVVGNRHLAYHAKLKKIFGNCEQMASNGKFVLLKSIKA